MLEFHRFDIIVFMTAVLCLAGVYFLWARQKNVWVFFWRLLNICALLLIAFQPVIVSHVKDTRPELAAAVDVSESMKITDRLGSAQKFLESWKEDLDKRFRVKYFAFAAGAGEAKNFSQLAKLKFGEGTDISRSLYDIKRDEGDHLSGILLLSDGNNNAPGGQDNWAGGLNVPVFPVALSTGKKITDAALISVKVGDFAFKNTPVEITATVSATGCEGKTLVVKLLSLDPAPIELAKKSFVAGSAKEITDVQLAFTPYASGEFRYAVEVEPVPGELTIANNRKTFSLEVVRDKLRVLFLCGQPGPEYAFLRQALKNDPLVELVSFVILRNPENIALASDEDLALIPFPVQNIFTKDIYNFDILIFENFTYRGFGFYPDYLRNIRNWVVDKGGGLVMIGGDRSFASGGWYETPVGDILPVYPEELSAPREKGLFSVSVEDYSHPVMTVDDDPSKNAEEWRDAPQLDGCQAVKIKPGASLLAKEKQGGWAAISAWDTGKGRVAAIGTNTTWRWALQSSNPDFYSRFWKNIMRYAARRSGEKKLHVSFDRPGYFEGQDYQMRVRSSDKYVMPAVEVAVTGPDGGRAVSPAKKLNDKTWVLNGRFDKSGEYRFSAALKMNGVTVCEEPRVQNVSASKVLEETELDNNETYLKSIAEDSGGKYFTKDTFSADVVAPLMKPARGKEDAGRKPLWDSPWMLALLVVSMFLELLFRRMNGIL